MTVPDDIIRVDSDFGKHIGFTGEHWHKVAYLWGKPLEGIEDCVVLSLPEAKTPDALRALVERILTLGWAVFVPLPRIQEHEVLEAMGGFRGFVTPDGVGGLMRRPDGAQ